MLVRRRATLRKEPSQERSSFTFEAILDAASQMVISEGAEALQMSILAKRAGVSAGSLYQYFPDKTSILMALGDRSCARFLQDARRAVELARHEPLEAFLERLSATVIELACRDHALHLALRAALEPAGTAGELEDLSEPTANFFARALTGKIDLAAEKLLALSRLMVWAADGLVEGVLRREEIPVVEARTALLSAWRAILASR
jgi:AcrR family transcriptional regulator